MPTYTLIMDTGNYGLTGSALDIPVPIVLHALPDDWTLNANGDLERGEGVVLIFNFYLTDEAGNRLTDELGNYLVGPLEGTYYPQILHTLPDDFKLNAE